MKLRKSLGVAGNLPVTSAARRWAPAFSVAIRIVSLLFMSPAGDELIYT
jgi:hypothetical protein